MKKILKYSLGALLLGCMVSCSPEEFEGANPNAQPTTSANTISIDVQEDDPSINTAIFSTQEIAGQYPIWYLDGKFYSNLAKATYSTLEAGNHTLELYIGNRNGISVASVKSEFTFKQTKVDYTSLFNKLCDKDWKINYSIVGHLGCGESGTDGSNWWSAQPNDKADWGVYDDVIKFSHTDSDPVTGGSYTYEPGEGGTVYINTGCKDVFADSNTNDGNDYMATVEKQTTTFTIETGTFNDESALFIHLPAKTLFPYIPNDETYADPLYRIESISSTTLILVCDNGSISWRFVFTCKEIEENEENANEDVMDWDYNSDSNLWKSVDNGTSLVEITTWFANGSWEELANQPTITHDNATNTYEFDVPEGIGSDQWQGQLKIATKLSASVAKAYNFYLTIDADDDIAKATIKFTQAGGGDADNNYFFADRHDIKAGKQFVYKAEDVVLPNGDAEEMTLVFDFGGAPAGAHVKISNIYFEETVLLSYTDPNNLWKSVDDESALVEITTWFANGSWEELANQPTITHTDNAYELTIPEGIGGDQWQGQLKISTTLSASTSKKYNFALILEANDDIAKATIKFTQTGGGDADNNYFFADRHDIKAGKAYKYKVLGVTLPNADASALTLVFDFGGAPAGTNVKISDIIFEEAE